MQGLFHGFALLSAILTTLAVRLTLGAHQSIPVDIHRRRDLRVAHQLLLHPDRRPGIVQPRPIGSPTVFDRSGLLIDLSCGPFEILGHALCSI